MAVALIAAAATAIGGTASAATIHFERAGEIEWSGTVTSEGPMAFACNATLAGELFESSEAEAGEEIGSISSAVFESCSNETTIRTLAVFPLPIVLDRTLNDEGTLVGFLARIEGIGILIEYPRLLSNCLYNLSVGLLTRVDRNGSTETSISLLFPIVRVRVLSGFLCPVEQPVGGELVLSPTQTVEVS